MNKDFIKNILTITLVFAAFILINSCRKDEFYNGEGSILTFSEDTLTFDTVFTTVGSVTRQIRVNNTSNQSLLLSINLKNLNGLNTFRINVDGVSGTSFKDVQIPPNDYIYIFAEATVDLGNVNNPFVIEDIIEYTYNSVAQKSYLQAWGQDAYFHYGEIVRSDDVVWLNDKPHVVIRNSTFPGYAIDSFSSLTVEPGCDIYIMQGAGIYIEGELIIGEETNSEIVNFQSGRIEALQNGTDFNDKPGLWNGITIFSGGKAEIYNTVINQAIWGIQGRHFSSDIHVLIDNTSRPDILLDKVIVKNSSLNALISINSKVKATNSIFYASGNNTVAIALGGEVEFDNCTMFNNGVSGSDDVETLILSNFVQTSSGSGLNHLNNATFTNCIIFGNAEEQIAFSQDAQVDFNYNFTNCVLKTKQDTLGGFTNCLLNENPQFVDASDGDFHLKDNSPCISAGIDNGVLEDINFDNRTNFDIGALAY